MNTKLFFIDETGELSKKSDKYILRGGFLIDIKDYFNLSQDLIKLKNNFSLPKNIEIKWSDVSIALYLMKSNKKITEKHNCYYLKNFSEKRIELYIDEFFKLINKYDFKIIVNITDNSINIDFNSLLEMQIQNLMQRIQYDLQGKDSIAIMIHDTINKEKDDKIRKIYNKTLSSDCFVKKYSTILDSILIDISSFSSGIQISDFIIGAISGSLRGYNISKTIYNTYLKNKIRSNKTIFGEKILGYGIIFTPSKLNNCFSEDIKLKLGL